MVTRGVEFEPISVRFGAHVEGVQLSGALPSDMFDQIWSLWKRFGVLLFRDQTLSKEDLIGFSRLIGPLERHLREEWLDQSHPEILQITNMKQNGKAVGALGDGEVGWHYDQIYLRRPALASVLMAVQLPPEGGATSFADMTAAYERLPTAMKDRIDGRIARQSYDRFNRLYSTDTNADQKKIAEDVYHPLVRTHPLTGRRSLYLCPTMTEQIMGLPVLESDAVLAELRDWCVQPEFVYTHHWHAGDAILWDNACTIHRREPFDPNAIRLMHRTTILPPATAAVPF
jgi:taurine dioxygenase